MTKELLVDEVGRIELPTDLREKFQIDTGDRILLEELPSGEFIFKAGKDVRHLFGILPNNGIHLTIEQINEIIAQQGALP